MFGFRRAAFYSLLTSKLGNILAKAGVLCKNLSLDGASIASRSQTHPSHCTHTLKPLASYPRPSLQVSPSPAPPGNLLDHPVLAFSLDTPIYVFPFDLVLSVLKKTKKSQLCPNHCASRMLVRANFQSDHPIPFGLSHIVQTSSIRFSCTKALKKKK